MPIENEEERKLAENIKKLKAKKEADAKLRSQEAKDKKQNLLNLRAEKKAELKAKKELKSSRTKTVITREDVLSNGRNQCDNDDYGFESSAADSFYDKLMKKYEANPEDPMAKFARFVICIYMLYLKNTPQITSLSQESSAKKRKGYFWKISWVLDKIMVFSTILLFVP